MNLYLNRIIVCHSLIHLQTTGSSSSPSHTQKSLCASSVLFQLYLPSSLVGKHDSPFQKFCASQGSWDIYSAALKPRNFKCQDGETQYDTDTETCCEQFKKTVDKTTHYPGPNHQVCHPNYHSVLQLLMAGKLIVHKRLLQYHPGGLRVVLQGSWCWRQRRLLLVRFWRMWGML